MVAQQRPDFNADEAMVLQEKVNTLSEHLHILQNAVITKNRERAKATLTKGQLDEMPADTKMYVSVGRSFLKSEKGKIETQIAEHIEGLEKELPSLTNSFG